MRQSFLIERIDEVESLANHIRTLLKSDVKRILVILNDENIQIRLTDEGKVQTSNKKHRKYLDSLPKEAKTTSQTFRPDLYK